MKAPLPQYRLTGPALAVCVLLSQVSWAEETTLPTVQVTSTAPSAGYRADLEPDSIRNPYRVETTARYGAEIMTREDIEALAPKDVIDLLDKAAGLNVTYQGRRSPFFIEERGGGSMTYILDGAILPSSANRILQKLPMSAIEEVQIMRGSTSLALGPSISVGASNSGSGLNTGFVVIRTRQPQKTGVELSAFAEKAEGQPAANGQSVFAGTRLGKAESSGYVGGLISRSDYPSKDSWFDGRNAQNGMLSAGFSDSRFQLGLMAYQDEGRFEMQRGVSATGALDNSKWYYDPLKTTVLSANAGVNWSKNQVTLLSVFDTRYQQSEINDSFANSSHSTRQFEEKTNGFSLRHSAQFGDTLVQLGRQLTNSKGYGPNTNTAFNDWLTKVSGWSASVEQKLFDKAVTLDAGFRRDVKHIDHSATAAKALSANSDVDMAPSKVFTLGARWEIRKDLAMNARYFDGKEGTSGDFDLRTKNKAPLHAMKQKRSEFAVEYEPWSFLRGALTLFDVDIRNLKSATTDTYLVNGDSYYYYTESDSRQKGVELAFKGAFESGLDYGLSWTHMLKNQTKQSGTTSDLLGASSPKDSYILRLGYRWDKYRFNASLKHVSGWGQSQSPLGMASGMDLGSYTRVDLNAIRDFDLGGNPLSVKLYVRNLGNDKYATRYTTGYYYDRGLTVGLETTAKF